MIGTKIGSYQVTALIGEGGMGQVFMAEHALIGREAAIKVLLPQFSHRQEIVNRFFNEAKAATAIKHPGIVEIYDFGYHTDGSAFIVMELLRGESLEARLRRLGSLPLAFALDVIAQMANALAAAHAQGIVHRDLKPENVFLVPDPVSGTERTKILDFGIAKLAAKDGPGSQTGTGVIMGTPSYMAPEQCRGAGQVDQRADLYSLGCMLFELLCSRPPFNGEGAGEVLAAHIHVAPPSALSLAPTLPAEVDAIIVRLLAKDPAHRPQSATELLEQLRVMLAGPAGAHQSQPLPRPASAPAGTLLAPGSVPPGSTPPTMQQSSPGSYPPAVGPSGRPSTGPQGTMKLGSGSYPPQVAAGAPASQPPTMHLGTDPGASPADGRVTTLGAAAGATPTTPPAKGSSLKIIAGIAAMVAVAGGAFALTRGGGGDEATGQPPLAAASPKAETTDPVTPAAPVEKTAEPPAPAPVTPPVAAKVTIAIESNPPGAAIYRQPDGIRLGTTPWETTRAATEGELELVLMLSGHKRRKILVSAGESSTRVVQLARLKRKTGSKKTGSKKTGSKKTGSKKTDGDRTVDPFSK